MNIARSTVIVPDDTLSERRIVRGCCFRQPVKLVVLRGVDPLVLLEILRPLERLPTYSARMRFQRRVHYPVSKGFPFGSLTS